MITRNLLGWHHLMSLSFTQGWSDSFTGSPIRPNRSSIRSSCLSEILVHGHGKWPTGFHYSTTLRKNPEKYWKTLKNTWNRSCCPFYKLEMEEVPTSNLLCLRLHSLVLLPNQLLMCQSTTRKQKTTLTVMIKWWACAKPSSWTSRWDSRNFSAFPANHHRRSQGKYGLWSCKKDHPSLLLYTYALRLCSNHSSSPTGKSSISEVWILAHLTQSGALTKMFPSQGLPGHGSHITLSNKELYINRYTGTVNNHVNVHRAGLPGSTPLWLKNLRAIPPDDGSLKASQQPFLTPMRTYVPLYMLKKAMTSGCATSTGGERNSVPRYT